MKRKKRVFAVASGRESRQFDSVQRLTIVGWIAVVLVAWGCVAPGPGHKLTWRTLSRGLTSGLTEPRRVVVTSEVEFLKLWAEHAEDVNRPALPPVVDFETQMVVVLALGNRPTGGYFVEVVDVELRGDTVRVLVAERTPSPGILQVQQPTQPFQFVALPAMKGRVEFRTVREAARPRSKRGRGSDSAELGEDTARSVGRSIQPVPSPRGAVR